MVLVFTELGWTPSLNWIEITRPEIDVPVMRGPSVAWRLNDPEKGISVVPSSPTTEPCKMYEYCPLASRNRSWS